MWFLKLVRWPNLLILALLQILAAMFLQHNLCSAYISDVKLLYILISTILIASAGNIINDIQDVNIDAVNKPHKVIIGRYLSRKKAIILYGLITFTGLVTASFVGFQYFIWTLIAAQILWLYSVVLKCQPLAGNIAIAALMGLSVWVVQFAGNYFHYKLLLFYTAFAFLTGFIREIIKDVEDKDGDKAFGCHTFAVKASLQKVKNLVYILLVISLMLLIFSAVVFFLKGYTLLAIYLLVVVCTAFVFYAWQVKKAQRKEQFSRLSLYIKLIMLAGILSMPLEDIKL